MSDPSTKSNSAKVATSSEGQLETTIFKPSGNGPFPLLILNHGKVPGNTHLQERARFLAISREFVKRGYAVIIPMRTGFAKSSGEYVEQPCDMNVNGQRQADDVESVLDYVRRQSWADGGRVLIAGQSYGGLTTMAFGTRNAAGVKGLINFAGGLRINGGDCHWQASLVDAFGVYGAKTAVPSIWFYGENDSYFAPVLVASMHEAYLRGGGNAKLIAFGRFKKDAHAMSSSRDGVTIWWPETERFLRKLNMPTEVVMALPDEITPQKTDFAALDDVGAIPYLKEKGREQYRAFLGKSLPRAFAISASGVWSWAEDGDEPMERAIANCRKLSAQSCKMYAVDDQVVWTGTRSGSTEVR